MESIKYYHAVHTHSGKPQEVKRMNAEKIVARIEQTCVLARENKYSVPTGTPVYDERTNRVYVPVQLKDRMKTRAVYVLNRNGAHMDTLTEGL